MQPQSLPGDFASQRVSREIDINAWAWALTRACPRSLHLCQLNTGAIPYGFGWRLSSRYRALFFPTFFTGLPASSRDPEKNAIPATWKPSAVAGQRQHCEPPHFIFTFAQHCCYFCLMSHSHLICGSLSSCTNIGAKSRSLTLLRMPHSHHTIPAWQI